MVSRYIDKNKYNGITWEIKLDSIFRILIFESDSKSKVVEFQEWKIFNRKTQITFISNDDLEQTVKEAFDKVYVFFLDHKKYDWSFDQLESQLNQALREIYHTIIHFRNITADKG